MSIRSARLLCHASQCERRTLPNNQCQSNCQYQTPHINSFRVLIFRKRPYLIFTVYYNHSNAIHAFDCQIIFEKNLKSSCFLALINITILKPFLILKKSEIPLIYKLYSFENKYVILTTVTYFGIFYSC